MIIIYSTTCKHRTRLPEIYVITAAFPLFPRVNDYSARDAGKSHKVSRTSRPMDSVPSLRRWRPPPLVVHPEEHHLRLVGRFLLRPTLCQLALLQAATACSRPAASAVSPRPSVSGRAPSPSSSSSSVRWWRWRRPRQLFPALRLLHVLVPGPDTAASPACRPSSSPSSSASSWPSSSSSASAPELSTLTASRLIVRLRPDRDRLHVLLRPPLVRHLRWGAEKPTTTPPADGSPDTAAMVSTFSLFEPAATDDNMATRRFAEFSSAVVPNDIRPLSCSVSIARAKVKSLRCSSS